jgi:nucleoid-associated protein YgaU
MKMVKAKLEEAEGATSLEFKFNPSEYAVKKGAHWEAPKRSMKSKAGSRPDYIGSDPATVSLQIFFDDWEAAFGDVSRDVDQLFDWCTPSKISMGSKPQPPLLRFIWGSNLQLRMQQFYLESVSVKYTMFGRSGNPLRATADITLKEVPNEQGPQNPTSGAIYARRTHLISEGDTLQSIASGEYGNPNLWRGLALFNEIDDPMRLTLGSRILLPSQEEASEGSR